MSLHKIGVLSLLTVFCLSITTSCRKDHPPVVVGVEETSSPEHLSEWLEQLNAIIRATNKSGAEASRILAYASIAYYEAYALSDESMRSLVGQLQGLPELPSPNPELNYNYGVIAEATITEVLLHLFNDAPSEIKLVLSSTFESHENDYAFLGVSSVIIDRSRTLGSLIGGSLSDWIDLDGYSEFGSCVLTVPEGDEYWNPTPPHFGSPDNLCWGTLRPFTFSDDQVGTLCHPGNPIEVSSDPQSTYFVGMEQLQQYSSNLISEQQNMALFWSDGPDSFTVPGHYTSILRQLIDRNTLSGSQTVTACAKLCVAMADVYISAYQLKYTVFRPRPVSFIDQHIASNWEPFIETPETAEYPSIRTSTAYAAVQVYTNLYGDVEFTDNTHSLFGFDARYFSSFTAMAEEVTWSRVYGGVSLQSTVDASEYHGRCIAQRANELFLSE